MGRLVSSSPRVLARSGHQGKSLAGRRPMERVWGLGCSGLRVEGFKGVGCWPLQLPPARARAPKRHSSTPPPWRSIRVIHELRKASRASDASHPNHPNHLPPPCVPQHPRHPRAAPAGGAEGAVHRADEPRAAHAAQRHHRPVQRAAHGRRRVALGPGWLACWLGVKRPVAGLCCCGVLLGRAQCLLMDAGARTSWPGPCLRLCLVALAAAPWLGSLLSASVL